MSYGILTVRLPVLNYEVRFVPDQAIFLPWVDSG